MIDLTCIFIAALVSSVFGTLIGGSSLITIPTLMLLGLPPHAAMLATGTVKPRPGVRDGQVVVRQTMTTTISVDHRVSDGAEAAGFLQEYKRCLEQPLLLLA